MLSFGTGAFGRLGFTSNKDQLEPRTLPISGRDITCVSAGLYHSALVASDHCVLVFGSNATDCLGDQLSPQTLGDVSEPDDENSSSSDREIAHNIYRLKSISRRLQIVQVSVGGDLIGAHTLAVSKHGRLYAMGHAKACGINTRSTTVKVPMLVTEFVKQDPSGSEVITLERVAFAAAGGSCSAVITTEGRLYTFGITASGRLGHDRKSLSNTVQLRPKRVDALLLEDPVATVSVGGSHMLCVTQRGQLFAWGDNGKGQLGVGDYIDRYKPSRIDHPNRAPWAPVIAAGEGHSLAVDVHGKLFSWGGVRLDQERERALCISFQLEKVDLLCTTPRQVKALADYRIERVSAGVGHSVAISTGGIVFIWGSKNQIGLLSVSSSSIPRVLFAVGETRGLVAGPYHTLVMRNSEFVSVPFERLTEIAAFSQPCASADGFILCQSNRKLWINTAAIRSRVSSSAWTAFWKPQISLLNRDWGSCGDLSPPSLSNIAQMFKIDSTSAETSKQVASEYERIENIIDKWVDECCEETAGDGGEEIMPKLPLDCMFESLSLEMALKFLRIVLSDELPPDLPLDGTVESEEIVSQLTKLSICSQLDRAVALLKQRLKRIEKDRYFARQMVPKSSIKESMETLFRKSINAANSSFVPGFVYFHCGPFLLRESHAEVVAIHSFVAEGWCKDLALPAGDSTVDRSPARRRNGWMVSIEQHEGGVFHVDCPLVPVDVMQELSTFLYLNRFNEAVNSVEVDFAFDQDESLKFWANMASCANTLGSEGAQAAAMDKLVARMNESNCLRIASQCKNLKKSNLVVEGALSLAEHFLSIKVLQTEPFKKRYPLAVSVERRDLVESTIRQELRDVDITIAETVIERVVCRIESKLSLDDKLKKTLEHFQGLNAEIVPELASKNVNGSYGGNRVSVWMKSLTASVRGGPSLLAAGRDLVFVIAVAAALGMYFSSASLAGMPWSSLVLVCVNFFAVIVTVMFLYTHFGHKRHM